MTISKTWFNSAARRTIRRIGGVCIQFGFDPRLFASSLSGTLAYLLDIRKYTRSVPPRSTLAFKWGNLRPFLHDKRGAAGVASGHYFHMDIWAARKIYDRRPAAHTDIGSRIDGFISHLLVFMPVTVIDIRALDSDIEGLRFISDDATNLAGFQDKSIDSLSCLHAAEHFGLGRYSDPIDPDACFKLINSLQRVLSKGGRLYFAVPIGRERVEFNAHRVFFARTIVEAFGELSLLSFSTVDDMGKFHKDANLEETDGMNYGCGLFEFTRL